MKAQKIQGFSNSQIDGHLVETESHQLANGILHPDDNISHSGDFRVGGGKEVGSDSVIGLKISSPVQLSEADHGDLFHSSTRSIKCAAVQASATKSSKELISSEDTQCAYWLQLLKFGAARAVRKLDGYIA